MRRGLVKHRLVEHQVSVGQAGFDVAHFPLIGDLAIGRQRAVVDLSPIDVVPLDVDKVTPIHGIAFQTGIRASWPQTVQRVKRKRQRLEVNLHLLNGIRRLLFRRRRNRQDRLTFIQRLVRQHPFFRRIHRR